MAAALGGGWDPANNEYQATIAGNYGHTDVMHGRLDAVWLSLPVAGAVGAELLPNHHAVTPKVGMTMAATAVINAVGTLSPTPAESR